jgi:peptide/nickel transport system ATP-binding protein
VLYRGRVVEEGDPEQVVNRPRHAYTRLLIDSIPEPNPEQAWADEALTDMEADTDEEGEVTRR